MRDSLLDPGQFPRQAVAGFIVPSRRDLRLLLHQRFQRWTEHHILAGTRRGDQEDVKIRAGGAARKGFDLQPSSNRSRDHPQNSDRCHRLRHQCHSGKLTHDIANPVRKGFDREGHALLYLRFKTFISFKTLLLVGF